MFFVMLRQQDGSPSPLVTYDEGEDGTVVLFQSEAAAQAAGDSNMLGRAFGYEVFPWDE